MVPRNSRSRRCLYTWYIIPGTRVYNDSKNIPWYRVESRECINASRMVDKMNVSYVSPYARGSHLSRSPPASSLQPLAVLFLTPRAMLVLAFSFCCVPQNSWNTAVIWSWAVHTSIPGHFTGDGHALISQSHFHPSRPSGLFPVPARKCLIHMWKPLWNCSWTCCCVLRVACQHEIVLELAAACCVPAPEHQSTSTAAHRVVDMTVSQ